MSQRFFFWPRPSARYWDKLPVARSEIFVSIPAAYKKHSLTPTKQNVVGSEVVKVRKKHPKIRKDDKVVVIAGKEKGKIGVVLKLNSEKGRVIVEKVNVVKRHTRPSMQTGQGGIIEKEAPLQISNVMINDFCYNNPSICFRTFTTRSFDKEEINLWKSFTERISACSRIPGFSRDRSHMKWTLEGKFILLTDWGKCTWNIIFCQKVHVLWCGDYIYRWWY